ncbi:MAG: hypothetical protein K6A23_10265, partial [Butyrivibrio sp.]|nr:hypothetical protein [Butyrivibrio sp.]
LYTNDTANTDFYVEGVMSYRLGTDVNENIKAKGTQDETKIYSSLNFYWNDGASSNSDGLTVTDDWFVSLDAPDATTDTAYILGDSLRNDDGSINLNGFMQLSETGIAALAEAGIEASDVAAVLDGNYEAAESVSDIPGYEPEEEEAVITEENLFTRWAQLYCYDTDMTTLVTDSFVTIDGNTYYFGSTGAAKKGVFTVDGNSYYAYSTGILATGLVSRWASLYYYDPDTCAMVTNEFVTVDGNTYYFGSNGTATKGVFTVDGASYYGYSTGILATGLVSRWATTYYYDSDTCQMVTGFVNVTTDGETVLYHFGSNGAATKGWFTVDGSKYYAKNGIVQKGDVTIWFVTYHFDEETGALTE